ncbi:MULTISPECIES: DUF2255 family protein [Lactobacillaceae]|uniref:DUF2255 family protein n=1 Tax=Lactobacillaceae TaxID=33958 RepID=UPI0014575BB8|nr:DUF2255 family protein [Lactobacillus sp. HBUAS51381]NLR10353.1 DUF2255 family protein [Lactobacillus sp. HBUAS51381]
MQWSQEQLATFASAATLTIEPYNADLTTFEEVSPIWEVVVDGRVYSRGWNGRQTKWYQAAVTQVVGEIKLADQNLEAEFKPVTDGPLLRTITAAYQRKYPGDSSLARMISAAPTGATIQVLPRSKS